MKDPLKSSMLAGGIVLFIVGALLAYRTTSLNDQATLWTSLWATLAGVGVGMAWSSRSV